MTPLDILMSARDILNDPTTNASGAPVTPRQSNDELLRYLGEAVGLAMTVRPEFFYRTVSHVCTSGALQSVSGAQVVVDVPRVSSGAALTVFDKAAMDAFDPAWVTAATGDVVQGGDELDLLITYTSSAVIDPLYSVVYIDASANDVTLTLPAASILGAGISKHFSVKRIDNSVYTAKVKANSPETLDGDMGAETSFSADVAIDFRSDGVIAWSMF